MNLQDDTLEITKFQKANIFQALAEDLESDCSNELAMADYIMGFGSNIDSLTAIDSLECGSPCCVVGRIASLELEEAKLLIAKHTRQGKIDFETMDAELVREVQYDNYLTHHSNPNDKKEMARRCHLWSLDLRDNGSRLTDYIMDDYLPKLESQ